MSGWGVYDVIIEIILNIFQGFMVTWYLQKCLGTDREKKDVYITGTVYTFLYLMLQGYFTDFEGVGILIYLGLSLFFSYMMLMGYPPVANMVSVLLQCSGESELEMATESVVKLIRKVKEQKYNELFVIGPADPPVSKINDIYRKIIYLKSAHRGAKNNK